MSINAASGVPDRLRPTMSGLQPPPMIRVNFSQKSILVRARLKLCSCLGTCPPGPGNLKSLSNSTRVDVLILAFRRRCLSSGYIGAVAPSLRRPTPGPPKFAVAPVTRLRGSEMIGKGRPCLGHFGLAPFGVSNRCCSSWPRSTALGATAPRVGSDVFTRPILLHVDL